MIKHIEMEKSYTNPDFRLEDLAKIVGTNRSYASAALNKKEKHLIILLTGIGLNM